MYYISINLSLADFPLKIGYDAPNTIKIRANQLQSITQCNANTDLNFRLKFSKTTWPTEISMLPFTGSMKVMFAKKNLFIIKYLP
jgi:hypothetical protein